MGRRVPKGPSRQTWTLWLAVGLTMLVAFPAGGLVYAYTERFGSTDGPTVIAAGTATVRDCESRLLREPYVCEASVVWREAAPYGEPPAEVTVRATRQLSGQVEVQERQCGARYANRHACPVYAADYPSRSGLMTVLPILVLVGLMPVCWLVARCIAALVTRHRAAP